MGLCKPVAFYTHLSTNTTYIVCDLQMQIPYMDYWVQLSREKLPAHNRWARAASSEEAAAKIPLSALFSPCPKDCFYLSKWIQMNPWNPCHLISHTAQGAYPSMVQTAGLAWCKAPVCSGVALSAWAYQQAAFQQHLGEVKLPRSS